MPAAIVPDLTFAPVESGLVTFEDAFLPYTVLPGGMTVADVIRGGVAEAYATGQVPALLPDYRRAIEARR